MARTDDEALAALERLARTEGILCALETAHAIAALDEVAKRTSAKPDPIVIVGLSGRGDKDMVTIAQRRHVVTRLRAAFDTRRAPRSAPRSSRT